MATTLEGTDSKWIDGDITDDWADEDDPAEVYAQRLARLITCNGLWYAPTRTLDVRSYVLDTADATTMQIEIQSKIDGDEETARSVVRVSPPSETGGAVVGTIEAWTKRGHRASLTLAIDAVTGDLLVNRGS